MTWLIPSALGIAGIAIAGLVAAHFIARSRPLAEPLPTARFIPERAIRARSRSFALSDVWLLLLRAAAIAGLALGGLTSATSTTSNVRVARGEPSLADSVWSRGAGHVLVHWPATPADAAAWPARPRLDAIGGVVSESGTLVGRFPRLWMLG